MLNDAVDALKDQPNTSVYLDGTHSAWLGSGDAADRLIQAGVGDADGFFLNVSNYRLDAHLEKYGTWTAKCIAFASNPASWGVGHSEWCASQYFPANPERLQHVGPDRPVVRGQRREPDLVVLGVGARALRRRHEPQRAGPVDAARVSRPAGLVQPAGPRPGTPPNGRHRQRPDRRLPLDQDPGRVRRRMHARPRAGRRDRRPGVGRRRSRRRRLVPGDGARLAPNAVP